MTSPDPSFLAPESGELGAVLEGFRERLERLLELRMDPRLRRRVDPADVLQEAYAAVVQRLEEYRARRPMPFYLWVRIETLQILARVHHRHLGTAQRAADREITPGSLPGASTQSLARAFVQPGPSPSQEVAREELFARVRAALERMDALDREILALRYFERLSNEEAALVLGMTPSGATKRHVRALAKLRAALPRTEDVPTPS